MNTESAAKAAWLIEMCNTKGWRELLLPGMERRKGELVNAWLVLDDPTGKLAVEIRAQIKLLNWLIGISEEHYQDVVRMLDARQNAEAVDVAVPQW